ncbi:L-aspartate oxidase [Verrucomicrobia bacterium]|nr:L-aspartate oxidase [Verrucomicrobiota bacterium]
MIEYDYVVVGTGVSGLSFALRAAQHGRVAVITKRKSENSNTSWAQGGICCVADKEDSFESHITDTIGAGAGLCNKEVVRKIVESAPDAIEDMVNLGVEFDKTSSGEFELGKEGGHTQRRILHSKDTTGKEISENLISSAKKSEKIDIFEHHFAIDVITKEKLGIKENNEVVGIYVLDETKAKILTFRTKNVILSTGGCGRVYLYTTNPDIATGDGLAMAYRAGAEIANMEFIQFHPTCLYHHELKNFLISEAVRGEGGKLIGKNGKEFMHDYDARGSLAPRDIVARAIDHEIKRTGEPCVYVDISHKSKEYIAGRFPNIYKTCLSVNIDPSNDPIPVVPAAHYQCGGVKTSIDGQTSIKGLYAIGEVACTGLHGANRLASNSLLEGAVMAARAAEHMILQNKKEKQKFEDLMIPDWTSGEAEDVDELVVIYHNWDEIRRLMWDYVSIVRTNKRLKRAATRLQNLSKEVQEFYWNFKICSELLELRNLVETASLIVRCAQRREESRGLHYTLDFPDIDDSKIVNDTVISLQKH